MKMHGLINLKLINHVPVTGKVKRLFSSPKHARSALGPPGLLFSGIKAAEA
jgi:hypothetical protein